MLIKFNAKVLLEVDVIKLKFQHQTYVKID